MKIRIAFLAFLCFFASISSSHAETWRSKFKNFTGCAFEKSQSSQPNSISLVADPENPSNGKTAVAFSVVPRKCVGKDCMQQSARSSVTQCENGKHPKEIWYGWELFLPRDFPHNGQQAGGWQQFAEWKDQGSCAVVNTGVDANLGGKQLIMTMVVPTGKTATRSGGDCQRINTFELARVSSLLGKWTKFELHAVWSKESDGRFDLFINGVKAVSYQGPTCTNCDKRNKALFGNYLCCTPDTQKIAPSTVYYRSISSGVTRDQLIWE